jgi:hypothetical protein
MLPFGRTSGLYFAGSKPIDDGSKAEVEAWKIVESEVLG